MRLSSSRGLADMTLQLTTQPTEWLSTVLHAILIHPGRKRPNCRKALFSSEHRTSSASAVARESALPQPQSEALGLVDLSTAVRKKSLKS